MSTVEVRCRCGAVRGRLENASPESVNRVVCYCDDCQAFAHHLGRADLLDDHGGTDIVQVAPASLDFHTGEANIVGLRFGPKGLHRWYANCCNTPFGNTVGPSVPFVGVVAQAFAPGEGSVDAIFGEPVGAILGRFAVGKAPPGATSLNVRLMARAIRKVLGWKLGGRTWPHPFFAKETGEPRRPLVIVPAAERQALQPLCGPAATRVSRDERP